MKTFFSILLILACALVSTSICLANDGSDITISGESPRHGIGSSLYTASSKDGDVVSCDWWITDFVKYNPTSTVTLAEVEKRGEDAYLTFHDFGSVTLKCRASVDIKGENKDQYGSRTIECKKLPPNTTPTLSINGEDYVSLNSEHEYVAECKAAGTPTITWAYPVNQTHTGEKVTIEFTDLGFFRLNCTLKSTDAQGNNVPDVDDHKDIHVLSPVVLTALRANYENPNVANIPGEEIVKIHYNIDDDDESCEENDYNKGCDCLQTAFKTGNENPDDDLCKLEISFGNNFNDFTEGTVYIEVTKGLRLWCNNLRTNDNDIFLGKDNKPEQIALSFSVPAEKTKIQNIINNGLYVEGLAPGYRYLKIKFADKQLKLPYYCYAVGEPQNQPDKGTRKEYKKPKNFPDLVDCEWCIKELSNTTYFKSYNCIAYAVDPRREVFDYNTASYATPFQEAFWVTTDENDLGTTGFDSWDENIWRTDPFVYEVRIANNDLLSLEAEYIVKFLNPNITPFRWRDSENYYFLGYSSAYRALLEDVLSAHPGRMQMSRRLTTMKIFNRNPSTQNYVKKFFTLPDFAASIYNGHQLVECDTNDNCRIVMYYSIFHAARALSKTFDCRKLGKNADPDWDMAVSKCGNFPELLIHRERQVSNAYGAVTNAYK